MVRVPRRLQELQSELATGINELSQRLGRSPTIRELAAHLGLTEEQVIEATDSARAYSAVPIDVPNAATGMTVADGLIEADTALDHVELRHALRPVLAGLGERERKALVMRFVENKTQNEIAQALGVSQVHVLPVAGQDLARAARQTTRCRAQQLTQQPNAQSTRSSAVRAAGVNSKTSTASADSSTGIPKSSRPAWIPSE